VSAGDITPARALHLTGQIRAQIDAVGIATFMEVGEALLAARTQLTPPAFDTFCRVHTGMSGTEVAPILAMVEAMR
jgi:hypothetical protein